MLIKSLRAPGFEGRDLNLEFSRFNLITAPPEVGKTSVLNAIQVAMFGYLPSLGETERATFGLSSDPRELFVRLTFDDGKSNTVTIARTDEGSCSQSQEMQYTFPLALMDANEYFTLSGKERLAYVLRRVNLKKCGYSDSDLMDALSTDRSHHLNYVLKWDKTIEQSRKDRDKVGQPVSDWLDCLVKQLSDALKSLRNDRKGQEAIIAALKPKDAPKDVSDAYRQAKEALQLAVAAQAEYAKSSERKTLTAELAKAAGVFEDAEADKNTVETELAEAVAARAKMEIRKSCPVCLAKGTDWKKEWLAEHAQKEAEIKARLRTTDIACKVAKQQVDKIEKRICDLDKKNASDKRRVQLDQARQQSQQKVDELEGQNMSFQVYQSAAAKAKTAQEKLDAINAEMTVVKHLSEKLAAYQSQVAEKAFGLLLKTVNQFTSGILRSPLVYRDGELRFDFYPEWATRRTFSGTQRMLVYSGLQVALCQDSPVKLVAIDEFGVCPPDWKRKIAQRLLNLIDEKVVDQVILLDCQTDWLAQLKRPINVIEIK